jgi:hypothetical protein
MIQDGQLITYKGDCDVIRTGKGFSWKEFAGDGIELIVGKKYEFITSCCMQWVYIKKDDQFIKDSSGERYLYWKIKNEQGEEIYVWEGFFEENTNL